MCFQIGGAAVPAQEVSEAEVLRMRTDVVTVPFVVTDSRGRRVFGLTQNDFVLNAEGRPQRIAFLSPGSSHVALIFLLDESGSAREYISKQRDTALSLFSKFGPQSEVAILRFSDLTTVAAPFLANAQIARQAFDFPASGGRHTAIFDAALNSLKLLDGRKKDPAERRIVILMSDGLDTASKVKGSEVIEHARLDGVSFYVIHFPVYTPRGDHLAPRAPARDFRNLASKTGGQYFVAIDAASVLAVRSEPDLAPIFKAIEEDLAGQYLIGFYPDDAFRDGRPHKIELSSIKDGRERRINNLRHEFSVQQNSQ